MRRKTVGSIEAVVVFVLVAVFLIFDGIALAAGPKEVVLDRFVLHKDGNFPAAGLIQDSAGNLYGTTRLGGASGFGIVFELTPPATAADAWTESILYSFQGGNDGANPTAGLVFDPAGNLYGTTSGGGGATKCSSGCGTAFQLVPPAVATDSWTENVLYAFQGGNDGANPLAGLILDSEGNLYGTTSAGGRFTDGTVFQLAPPTTTGGTWTETLLHIFGGNPDGKQPVAGLLFDKQGNLYGTTALGGGFKSGVIFKLHHTEGGTWNELLLYTFTGASDGGNPADSLVMDKEENLYGTTPLGGTGTCTFSGSTCGTVFRLAPPATEGGAWTETVLYSFQGGDDGDFPVAGLVFDKVGNLFGTTVAGGSGSCTLSTSTVGCGTVFQLAPPAAAGILWTETVLYSFLGDPNDGAQPLAGVIFGAKGGALLGTTSLGGHRTANTGVVFEVGPVQ